MCTPSFKRGEDEEGVKIWGREGRGTQGQCSGKVLQVTAAGAFPPNSLLSYFRRLVVRARRSLPLITRPAARALSATLSAPLSPLFGAQVSPEPTRQTQKEVRQVW